MNKKEVERERERERERESEEFNRQLENFILR